MNEILYSRNYADMITATNPPHSWYVEEAVNYLWAKDPKASF